MFFLYSMTPILLTCTYFEIHHVTTKACMGVMIEIGANVMISEDNGVI